MLLHKNIFLYLFHQKSFVIHESMREKIMGRCNTLGWEEKSYQRSFQACFWLELGFLSKAYFYDKPYELSH